MRFSFDIFGCARQYEQALYCTRLHENSRQAKVNKFSLVFWLNEIVGIFFIAYKILYWTFKGIYWLLKGTLNKLFGNNW